jgi:tripartite-type tricarboxylate transporter receptor subunit TctC
MHATTAKQIVAAIDDPKAQARLVEAGFEPKSSTQAEFAKLVREEIEKWRPVVKTSGATAD